MQGARWDTNHQAGAAEPRSPLQRAGRIGRGCKGEDSRSQVEAALGRRGDMQRPLAGSLKKWQETGGPAAEAVRALACAV